MDVQIPYILTFNAWYLKLIPVHSQYLFAERRLVMMLYWVANISLLLIWCIWHKCKFKVLQISVDKNRHYIRSYLKCPFIFVINFMKNAAYKVDTYGNNIRSPFSSRICTKTSTCIRCRYWDICENIWFSFAHTQ